MEEGGDIVQAPNPRGSGVETGMRWAGGGIMKKDLKIYLNKIYRGYISTTIASGRMSRMYLISKKVVG